MKTAGTMKRQLALIALLSVLGRDADGRIDLVIDVSRAPERKTNPWDSIQLTKCERANKSYDELQALRKQKWQEGN